MEDKKIHPADRVSHVQEYYLQKKMKEVAELNAAGHNIISLGIGGPDRMPAEAVVETLCETARRSDAHSYQLGTGLPELRGAFADFYRRWYQVDLDPSCEVIPLIGSKEGIMHISMAFLNPGDAVLVPDPGYPTYTSVSKLVGAEVIKYDLTPENGWQPDFDALDKHPQIGRVKIMWLNYPHMPTGTPARIETFERAVDFARRHGILLVHDNPYSFILNDKPLSLLSVDGARDVAIEMNSLSKSANMAGWRVGMMASNPQFISWVQRVKSNIDSGQFKPVMLAAIKALEAGPEWYDALNAEYGHRRQMAEEVMRALGCTFDPQQRGMFLWGRIPDDATSGEAVADATLRDARVFITPGFIFGKNGDRYVRISLCATVEALDEARRRILAQKS